MKNIAYFQLAKLIAVCIIPQCIIAQQQPLFETVIRFTDAMGNTDSVIIGYDPEAKWDSVNPQFGEEIIDAPFDSVFEVRVTTDGLFLFTNEITYLKKKISNTYPLYPSGCYTYNPLGFIIKAKYPPVKVHWDLDVFRDSCLAHSYIASHTLMFHILGWWDWIEGVDGLESRFQCMANDSIFMDSLEYYNPFPDALKDVITYYDGSTDTIYRQILAMWPVQWTYEVPCVGVLPIEQPWGAPVEVKVYPNPTLGLLRLKGISDQSHTLIHDVLGRVAGQQSGPDLDLSALPSGWYLLDIRDGDVRGYASVYKE